MWLIYSIYLSHVIKNFENIIIKCINVLQYIKTLLWIVGRQPNLTYLGQEMHFKRSIKNNNQYIRIFIILLIHHRPSSYLLISYTTISEFILSVKWFLPPLIISRSWTHPYLNVILYYYFRLISNRLKQISLLFSHLFVIILNNYKLLNNEQYIQFKNVRKSLI